MKKLIVIALLGISLAACSSGQSALEIEAQERERAAIVEEVMATITAQQGTAANETQTGEVEGDATGEVVEGDPDVSYTLVSTTGAEGLGFTGQGGEIDGVLNPTLTAQPGDIVEITLINGDGIIHDATYDETSATTGQVSTKDQQATMKFIAGDPGQYEIFCSVPGHREAGMVLKLQVGEAAEAAEAEQAAAAEGVSVIRNPAEVAEPVGDREPTTVRFDLVAQEVTGQLADGTTYNYFTFNGQIPGPMLRVRVGDTVEMHLKNDLTSQFAHSIDLHAVTGPGGGAVSTQTAPGEETMFTFQALNPGVYVYHCATASVPHHITNGMYGLIVVEPEGGMEPVDREFYVMQGELYTEEPFGTQGHLNFSSDKMSHETPEYFVFNGAAGALTTDENALRANVGETVRIFFGVGGPNFTSSFHVIGEIFDRVYAEGSITADPLTDVQTTMVPTGGAAVVEFTVEVPGRYILVDHSLSRLERGLAGFLYVEGDENPAIFDGATDGSGH